MNEGHDFCAPLRIALHVDCTGDSEIQTMNLLAQVMERHHHGKENTPMNPIVSREERERVAEWFHSRYKKKEEQK